MPAGFSRSLAYTIERMARGDHYRNFRGYMKNGGLGYFTGLAGLTMKSTTVKGNGVFVVAVCE